MADEDAYVIVYDRRQTSDEGKKITIGGVFCYNEFIQKIKQDINLNEDDEFVVTTTNRNPVVDDDSYVKLIESGDTLYILESIDQPLLAPVSEKIEFQPHYDTLIKSGIYEYYASEGHVNPLPFAFAELIDNALAATVNNRGSRNIDLTLFDDSSSGQSTICVSDNGMGMSSRQLNNWAIYRLSKFNRKETKQRRNIFEDDVLSSGASHSMEPKLKYMMDAPKSLNSDISWFGVGGKQAIFFIGSATRIISKPFNSCDVHEFTLSKEEFRRKEANRETIYSGYIRNRKAGDSSHITGNEEVTRQLIATETDEGRANTGFTSVIITGIDPKHIAFMKQGFGVWTRQLSHIYHYYIHGPEGNTAMSRTRRNVGALDVNLNITMHERGKPSVTVDLRQINDDLESQYIRTACNSFEFKAKTDGGSGIVEGIIRYHPFMYDRETFPLDPNADDDFSDYEAPDEPPARGRRPIFECYWNGRLIPYTFVDDFDWCRAPRKRGNIPLECYSRVSGCLFTNDRFQVSTNKLTFIDLEAKLRDRLTVFTRMILGQEQRAHIQRQFNDWLRECHEKYDKQVKFLNFIESFPRTDIFGRKPMTVYGAIEWDGKIFKEGQLVRTQRTTPVVLGRIKRFLLLGAHEGDVFAVGGEMEMVQEPESLYGEIRRFPLTKLDRVVSSSVVSDLIQEEEQKLPDKLVLSWPEGNEVKDGDSRQIGMTIGAMRIEIHNRRNESLQKLPSNAGGRKLLIEQRFTYTPSVRGSSPREIASHVTSHGRNWPYWFKKMDNIKSLGTYTIHLQTVLNESEASTYADGRTLPHMKISFTIREAPPSRFLVGILESPLRICEPFDIPLELQDKYGHPTEAAVSDKPIIESEELDISFDSVECRGNTLVMKSVVAMGSVISQHGKSFTVTVIIPGLERESQTMKIRLLPGKPHSIKILSLTKNGDKQIVNKDDDDEEDSDLEESGYHFEIENLSNISLDVAVIDLAKNVTLQSNLLVQAKFPPSCGVSLMKCDCSMSGQGVLSGRIAMKKLKKETKIIKTKIEILGCKNTESVLCSFAVKPSTKVSAIEIFYVDPSNEEEINLKSGSDIRWPAGDILTKLSFRLLDEAKREVTLNKNICSGLKVNWTNRVSIEQLCGSELPNIRVPTNMTDVKFCQVVFAGQKNLEFSFSIRPIAGEPAALKCKIVGSRVTQIGVIRDSPVAVTILDSYGNKLLIKEVQLNSLSVTGDGLDETLVVKTIENNQFLLNNIQFNEGPLGSRELCVVYGNDDTIKEYVLLQLVAGTPAMIEVQGWTDIEKPLAILSGTRIPEPIRVQLKDGWGNPSPLLGVKVLLGKDSGLKLTPNPGVLATDETGSATFGKFSVSGKRGEYNLSPRVVINRSTIEGIKLKLSVLPNTENPVSIKVKYDKDLNSVMAGSSWPDFTISVLSEEGTPVTSSVHICMAVWLGKPNKDKSVPTSAEFHRTDKPALGTHCFQGITAATNAGDYCLCFCLCESKNSRNFTMISEVIKVKVYPGPPYKLYPDVDPGTPTVSNSKISRTIVRNLTLILKDCHGNRTGQDLESNVVVTIETCDETLKSIEVPRFEGNSVRLRVPCINGSVRFQSLLLQEKSPGSDGGQYILHCEMESDQIDQKILPYRLKFLFYNDVEKQNRMSVLVKQRDILKNAIESYESLFNLHETLVTELKKTLKDADEKKMLILRELRKRDVELSPDITLENIDKLVESFAMDREEIFNQPRRHCMLKEYPDQSPEILGKIGHLAVILDDDVGRVLSWHMMGDMDCLVTFTTKKAKEVHRTTGGTQQLLPLDSIYKKNLPDHTRPLPHLRGVKHGVSNVTGNPVFARDMLYHPKDPDSCKIVFGMLLGETLIMDDLDSANAYRNQVVKYTYCPTILTRTGERIRSNGKFGGTQNRAPSFERLKGAVFGAKLPMFYDERKRQIDVMGNFKTSMLEYNSAVIELTNHETSLQTDEMLKKKLEHKEAVERLKEIELKIGLTKELSPRSSQRKTKASNMRYDSGASKRRRKYN